MGNGLNWRANLETRPRDDKDVFFPVGNGESVDDSLLEPFWNWILGGLGQ